MGFVSYCQSVAYNFKKTLKKVLTFRTNCGRLFPVMRDGLRARLGKQGAEIASIRGTMQALTEGEWMDKGYIQRRIQDLELRLINVQHELAEIEFTYNKNLS